MRWALTIAAVLFLIPLLTFSWLYLTGSKVLFIRNPNPIAVSVQVATQNNSYIETTDPKAISAGALTWLIYDPQIDGDSGLLCTGMRGTTRLALATLEHPMAMFSRVALDSCEGTYVLRMIRPHRTVRTHHITPPQPL